jgi:energy-coupling factor transporter transmembrane protein EcfT
MYHREYYMTTVFLLTLLVAVVAEGNIVGGLLLFIFMYFSFIVAYIPYYVISRMAEKEFGFLGTFLYFFTLFTVLNFLLLTKLPFSLDEYHWKDRQVISDGELTNFGLLYLLIISGSYSLLVSVLHKRRGLTWDK